MMKSHVVPVRPFALAVLGATGDLARRKLYPALWRRLVAGQAPAESCIIGAARTQMSEDDFRAMVRQSLHDAGALENADPDMLRNWLAKLTYFPLNAEDAGGWREFAEMMAQMPSVRVFYLAVAPSLAGALCRRLSEENMLGNGARVVLEKPFGRDLQSARALHAEVSPIITEKYIYRIDHYLGKETVQNLMALRFANTLLEPVWNGVAIDHVQITVAEQIGIGGRGEYYDSAGAARDMLQNHLLQLLCLVAMEPPARYAADDVRDAKLKVLQSLRPLSATALQTDFACGQYTGGDVPSYLKDADCAGSQTETFAALKCAVDSWRWAGVPFYLRTGKRLAARMSEIAVCFKRPPHSIFPSIPEIAHNTLAVRLQPREGITLQMNIKEPGPGGFRLAEVPLDMSFAETLGMTLPDAYERLLMDVVRGDQTLFMRADELDAAWQWAEPLVNYLKDARPQLYESSGEGPESAMQLMRADGREWRNIV